MARVQEARPFVISMEVTTDCCTSWDGVTCDDFGFVIGLDVSESFFDASIDSNSSVFNLHHLKALNLAGNSFLNFSFPTLVAKLCSLTYFNLSGSFIPVGKDNVGLERIGVGTVELCTDVLGTAGLVTAGLCTAGLCTAGLVTAGLCTVCTAGVDFAKVTEKGREQVTKD
ncbi:hypothetical protein Sjap_021656 [Stephania japonica]|uniref:Leucine-rich repeat-containing N-terminal plant-type domain-containing protein n=1 Tax=Stephania japonica TaxID=461633 RepID=A0AAP0EW73_9MAGN